MDNSRLPKQPLYWQLCLGMRNQGRPRFGLKDVVKRNMKHWRDTDGRRVPRTDLPGGNLLNLRTVLVERTDCTSNKDNDDEPIG